MRPLLLLLFLTLAACTDTGMGGQPPAPGDALAYANSTSTAAVVQVTGTAVSQRATIDAAYMAATATRQAGDIQATAQAAPTVTAQAEYESEIARGQAIQNAIRADVLRAEATATAVHLTELMAWERAQTAKRAQSAQFWYYFRYGFGTVFLILFLFGGWHIFKVIYYRFMPPPEAVYDGDGRPAAVHRSYQQVTRPYAIPAQTIRPERPQPVYVPTSTNSQRRSTLPPLNSVTRRNLNNWLVAVESGTADFNRPSADTYGIGHEVTDSIIQMALDGGYATKGTSRNDPVLPSDTFNLFVDAVAELPYSNMHPPTPTNVYPVNRSPDGANGSPGELFTR